eukprot:3640844-Rhodomonas_salina.2
MQCPVSLLDIGSAAASLMVAPVLCADLPALSDLTVGQVAPLWTYARALLIRGTDVAHGQWNTLEPDSTRGSCMLGSNPAIIL